jgi:deoxyribodipyrimidine photolyase-related protein
VTKRNLIVVLGDQLNLDSAAFDGFDPDQDIVWMTEVVSEAKHVWSHRARIAVFLAAMRHFRDEVRERGFQIDYQQLDDPANKGDFSKELRRAVKSWRPKRLIMVEPGEWRVKSIFNSAASELNLALEIRPDRHFLSTLDEFRDHAEGRKQLRLEYFYREMRRKCDILMDGKQPVGGKWNLDSQNRKNFSAKGPEELAVPRRFLPDTVTREVLELVENEFADHPGRLDEFDWPVTRHQAQTALDDFVDNRLLRFGDFQDAMWTNQPYLFHSRLSVALNLKLLDPRTVVRAAEAAYVSGTAPLNSVEGFVRQIIGWREYVRGVYWLDMPEYLERNELDAQQKLPDFYWSADTDMNCLRQAINQTLDYGYAHHIQRLMVTGLFALLLGVHPREVHEWYLAVYVDAVEWVELPNTLGMSQFADGGVMASKPYVATGKYIHRMSNYCSACPFNPNNATGDDACPFTTLYWDFLMRHEDSLAQNRRMVLQVKNLQRKKPEHRREIRQRAKQIREMYCPS